ncbi:MAG: hypothetical protein MZV64_31525 [Ignavibacteriales bacterium]|nr:hypothetical protein [Ignavibacteriales bacterium]
MRTVTTISTILLVAFLAAGEGYAPDDNDRPYRWQGRGGKDRRRSSRCQRSGEGNILRRYHRH